MEIFDITLLRWINTVLILGAISFVFNRAKKSGTGLLAVPLLVWLFQSFIFYLVFFFYFYGVFDLTAIEAEKIFSYWSSISRFMLLITLWLYLYYIQHSCRRGNGTL